MNFLDTAELYPVPPRAEIASRTERYLGSGLKRQTRERLVVARKYAGPGRRDRLRGARTAFMRANIVAATNKSLKRPQMDYLDLYQTHRPDLNVRFFSVTEFTPRKEGSKRAHVGRRNPGGGCGIPRAPFDIRALNP